MLDLELFVGPSFAAMLRLAIHRSRRRTCGYQRVVWVGVRSVFPRGARRCVLRPDAREMSASGIPACRAISMSCVGSTRAAVAIAILTRRCRRSLSRPSADSRALHWFFHSALPGAGADSTRLARRSSSTSSDSSRASHASATASSRMPSTRMFAAYRIDDTVAGRRTACRYCVSRGPAFNYMVAQRDSMVILARPRLYVAQRAGVTCGLG